MGKWGIGQNLIYDSSLLQMIALDTINKHWKTNKITEIERERERKREWESENKNTIVIVVWQVSKSTSSNFFPSLMFFC